MNLLGLLMAAMTTKNALGQIAKKTGLSEKQIKKLMLIAIPILIKYLTKNASSGDGAHSLLGALAQHSNKEDMGIQLKDADEKDGHKIIGHILGKKEETVTQNLSAQSGLTQEQVNQASNQKPAAQSAAPGIFSALLGTGAQVQAEEKDDAINGTALLQALLNARK